MNSNLKHKKCKLCYRLYGREENVYNKEKCTFADYINVVTYIVTIKGSLNAKIPCEKLMKNLIIKEAMQLPED